MVDAPLIASGFFTGLYSGLPYVVEPMRSADIGEVMGIDRQSFPRPGPTTPTSTRLSATTPPITW